MTKSTITREQAEEAIEGLEGLISRGVQSVYLDIAIAGLRQLVSAMDQKPALHRYRRKAVEPYGPYPWHYEVFVDYPRPVEGIEDEYFYAAPPVVTGFAVDGEPVGKPFMYGIADPDGNAYIDDFCVSEDLGLVEDTVTELNHDREEGDELNYSVVALYRHAQQPVVPDDVLEALQKVARIRLELNEFDGDRRGIADCLGDAEEALIEVVNRRASMLNGGKP